MKKLIFGIMALLVMTACNGNESKDTDSVGDTVKTASEGKTFVEFDVDKDWQANPFTWFKGDGLLLAVGDKEKSNAMTIGWGALGNIWREIGANTVTVYVAEGRYTYEFMESNKYFTVMAFEEDGARILNYMGTNSGRDGDKAKALGLHTLYTENGTPYYEEASLVLECEIIYKAPFEREGMSEKVKELYDNFPAGVHHIYIGNIVKAMKKE